LLIVTSSFIFSLDELTLDRYEGTTEKHWSERSEVKRDQCGHSFGESDKTKI